MAGIATGEGQIAVIKGATWGTAAAITGAIKTHARISLSASRGEFTPQDVGFGLFIQEVTKLEESVDVTIDCDLFYGSHAFIGLAGVLGKDTAAEVSTGLGDWGHTMDMQSNNDGIFFTVVSSYGSGATEVLEIPSVKFHTVKITQPLNGVAQMQLVGIGNRVVVSGAVNNLAALNACTYAGWSDDESRYCKLGAANHYFRINAASGGALTNSEDLDIQSFEVELTRPFEREYGLNGANSPYTKEPKQLSPSTGSLNIQLTEINSSKIDLLTLWANGTKQKAELFMDGSIIAVGATNRSIKVQFPKLELMGELPPGFDLPNNNSRMRPSPTFRVLKTSAAPAGMTGVTDYIRVVATDERITKYV